MPKQADIRVQVPCCTAQLFWDVVYERQEATERYHTSFNSSTSTSVTPWTSCQRIVNFTMPLKLPEFLKRMVGLDSVAVTEVQRVVWHGGGSFTVSSETNITNMMGAGRFTTVLQLTVTEQEQQPQQQQQQPQATGGGASGPGRAGSGSGGGCAGSLVQLVYSVRCGASAVPWPMSATIENVMSEKALVSMQSFLDFCMQLLEEHAVAHAAAAVAKAAAAAASPADGAEPTISPAAAASAAALLEPLSEDGPAMLLGSPAVVVNAVSGHSNSRGSMRHRWPSITCSQDLSNIGVMPSGGVGVGVPPGGDSFALRRQDTGTQGGSGGDVFWDAPENFGAASCTSGHSSGTVSPRQLLLQASSLRRLSGTGDGLAAGNAGGAAGAASAVAINAMTTETHQVAVAVDKLTVAVANLDGKLERLLLLQEQRHEQLHQHLLDMQRQQQQFQQQQGEEGAPSYLVDHPPGTRRGSGGSSSDADGGRSDVRWMFRVTLAVLLATLLIMAYWVLHPYTGSGFRPSHGGGGGTGPPAPVPLVSVLRLDAATRSLGGRAAGAAGLVGGGREEESDDSDGGDGGGGRDGVDGGGALKFDPVGDDGHEDGRMRVALQVAGRKEGHARVDGGGWGSKRVQGDGSGRRERARDESGAQRRTAAKRQRQGKRT